MVCARVDSGVAAARASTDSWGSQRIFRHVAEPQTRVAIYALVDPRTDDVRYIGKAVDPQKRLQQHLMPSQLGYYKSHKNSWLKGLLAADLAPQLQILAQVPLDQADHAERFWIGLYRWLGVPLTNGTAGGDGFRGRHSDATRAKMSAAAKGKKKSKEHASNISQGRMARRQAVGYLNSLETRLKMAKSSATAKLTEEQVQEVRDLAEAGVLQRVIADQYGIRQSQVSRIVNHVRRIHIVKET